MTATQADTAAATWSRKDLIGIEHLTREEIEIILDMAPQFVAVSNRPSGIKKVPLLSGLLVVLWFHEPSTRTRTSFELAAKRLSADTLSMATSTSSIVKGETLHDTLANIEAMRADVIILRHGCAGAPHILAERHNSHIINAGDGRHEHPTQALLDAFTMRRHIRKLRDDETATLDGVKVVLVGDIEHSRVARSNIHCLNKLGAKVTLCGPATLIPPTISRMGVTVTHDIREAVADADVVYALRMQLERQQAALFPSLREYIRLFRVDHRTMKFAKPDALVMHPGPINRDIELSAELADSARSVILEQVTNGVAIRMAVMHLLVNGRSGSLAR